MTQQGVEAAMNASFEAGPGPDPFEDPLTRLDVLTYQFRELLELRHDGVLGTGMVGYNTKENMMYDPSRLRDRAYCVVYLPSEMDVDQLEGEEFGASRPVGDLFTFGLFTLVGVKLPYLGNLRSACTSAVAAFQRQFKSEERPVKLTYALFPAYSTGWDADTLFGPVGLDPKQSIPACGVVNSLKLGRLRRPVAMDGSLVLHRALSDAIWEINRSSWVTHKQLKSTTSRTMERDGLPFLKPPRAGQFGYIHIDWTVRSAQVPTAILNRRRPFSVNISVGVNAKGEDDMGWTTPASNWNQRLPRVLNPADSNRFHQMCKVYADAEDWSDDPPAALMAYRDLGDVHEVGRSNAQAAGLLNSSTQSDLQRTQVLNAFNAISQVMPTMEGDTETPLKKIADLLKRFPLPQSFQLLGDHINKLVDSAGKIKEESDSAFQNIGQQIAVLQTDVGKIKESVETLECSLATVKETVQKKAGNLVQVSGEVAFRAVHEISHALVENLQPLATTANKGQGKRKLSGSSGPGETSKRARQDEIQADHEAAGEGSSGPSGTVPVDTPEAPAAQPAAEPATTAAVTSTVTPAVTVSSTASQASARSEAPVASVPPMMASKPHEPTPSPAKQPPARDFESEIPAAVASITAMEETVVSTASRPPETHPVSEGATDRVIAGSVLKDSQKRVQVSLAIPPSMLTSMTEKRAASDPPSSRSVTETPKRRRPDASADASVLEGNTTATPAGQDTVDLTDLFIPDEQTAEDIKYEPRRGESDFEDTFAPDEDVCDDDGDDGGDDAIVYIGSIPRPSSSQPPGPPAASSTPKHKAAKMNRRAAKDVRLEDEESSDEENSDADGSIAPKHLSDDPLPTVPRHPDQESIESIEPGARLNRRTERYEFSDKGGGGYRYCNGTLVRYVLNRHGGLPNPKQGGFRYEWSENSNEVFRNTLAEAGRFGAVPVSCRDQAPKVSAEKRRKIREIMYDQELTAMERDIRLSSVNSPVEPKGNGKYLCTAKPYLFSLAALASANNGTTVPNLRDILFRERDKVWKEDHSYIKAGRGDPNKVSFHGTFAMLPTLHFTLTKRDVDRQVFFLVSTTDDYYENFISQAEFDVRMPDYCRRITYPFALLKKSLLRVSTRTETYFEALPSNKGKQAAKSVMLRTTDCSVHAVPVRTGERFFRPFVIFFFDDKSDKSRPGVEHVHRKDGMVLSIPKDKGGKQQRTFCPYCAYSVSNVASGTTHLVITHYRGVYFCRLCGRGPLTSVEAVQKHRNGKEKDPSDPAGKKRLPACTEETCDQLYRMRLAHEKNHPPTKLRPPSDYGGTGGPGNTPRRGDAYRPLDYGRERNPTSPLAKIADEGDDLMDGVSCRLEPIAS